MADQLSGEGSSTSPIAGDGSDSTVELNVKTLDSQIYSFQVDKSMPVSSFKEKIANQIGVPVGQQRLIFRGKVLKDDHHLSDYHVENGHTLHLVARNPVQSQDSSDTSAGETNGNNSHQGNDASPAAPRGRIGQISHSVVLGTFNVGDQGEGIVPDLSRVIGAVLNSIGIGGQGMANVTGGTQSTTMSGNPPQGNGTEGTHGNVGSQSHAGNQAQSGQAVPTQHLPSLPQVLQIPIATAAVPIPSVNAPIPDSLSTLSEFMNRMEQTLSQNGYQLNTSSNNTGDLPRVDLPSNAQGLHTPQALGIVLHQAEQLLSNHAVAALSHIAGRLEQEGESSDPAVRSHIQTESVQVGLAMQHLGSLLLELGRTILTLRMGQTSAESVVNAGPAVYISPSGPNPIMVQPFPLQTSSLFGASVPPSNVMPLAPVGIGNVPRNVNIHIHAVGTRGSNGEGQQGERRNPTGSGDSGAARVLPVRNIIAAIPSRPSVVATPSTQPGPGASVSQPPSDSVPLSNVLADLSSRLRNLVGSNNMGQSESNNQNSSIGSGNTGVYSERGNTAVNEDGETGVSIPGCRPQGHEDVGIGPGTSSASEQSSATENAVPLGLGFGGLERKRRARQQRPAQSGEGGNTITSSNQNQQTSSQQARDGLSLGGQVSAGQVDMSSMMSQVLQSPALNGLLSGVSEQTGMGSPDVLRNMLQQFTQSPQMRNVVNQIAQQVDSQDVGNMFAGSGGQGGGFDFSRMFQQMMPIVSQAIGGGSAAGQPFSVMDPQSQPQYNQQSQNRDEQKDLNFQNALQPVAEMIEHLSAPEDVFRVLAENSFQLSGGGSGSEELVDELCSDEGLVNEYMELLESELRRRHQANS
ncbi:hypothetical protein UlMin_033987 [Ulmus minor]